MNPTDTIIVSAVVITGSTMVRRGIKNQKEYLRTLFFGFLLTFILLIIAVPLPTVAKGLAYMGMVGAFAVNGPEVFALVKGLAG